MRKFIDFLRALAVDDRLPLQNRVMLGGLLAYLLTPIDIIPDFVPVLGWLDDAFVTVIILDYVFNSADTEVILEHYPWNKKHFSRMKTYAERLSWMVPGRLKKLMFKQVTRLAIASKQDA
ncbi:MAG TPA: YkvA family protein [Acidobacteriota bacterium]|nr:YkvA family protein [Acidobacteriota bacterium]